MTITTIESDRITRLGGGLPLVVLPRSGPGILAARLSIRGGSSLDPSGQRGAHQLLAGLMTRGCGTFDAEALADLVEGAGAALRADASEDTLVVALQCAAEDAVDLLPLMLAMALCPTMAADQLELERQLNLQTLQRLREDPFQVAHDQLRTLLFGDGPYGHDPLGVGSELPGITREHLDPLLANLGREGAVLVLCGQPPESLPELLETPLQSTPWTTALPRSEGLPSGAQAESGIAMLEQDTEQLVLLLGAATVPLGHEDALALRLLQTHLGLGMSCRLFLAMREERGLAYDVGVHLPARCGRAPFVMHLSTSAERAAEATVALLDEWQRVLEEPLDETAFHLALAKYRGQEAMGRQTCAQVAERQALVLSHGLPADLLERNLLRAGRHTPADLLAAARRWLTSPSLSLVGPAPALEAAGRAWRGHPLPRAKAPA